MKINDYKPNTRTEAIGWLLEECSEVMHAIASCFRWGADNVHEGRKNIDILKAEIEDLKRSIDEVEKFL